MIRKNEITAEQKVKIEAARKHTKNKRIERRLQVLCLRADGKTLPEISELTEYHRITVSKIVSQYIQHRLSYMTQCLYMDIRRYMSVEQEAEVLKPFVEKAQQEQVVTVKEMAPEYQNAVGHEVGHSQIYYVLKCYSINEKQHEYCHQKRPLRPSMTRRNGLFLRVDVTSH